MKAEGLVRPQAGVKPLLISGLYNNPEGVTDHSVTPSGLLCVSPIPGAPPPAVVFSPLQGLISSATLKVGNFGHRSSIYFVVAVTFLDVPPEMVAPVVYEPFQRLVSGLLMLVLP